MRLRQAVGQGAGLRFVAGQQRCGHRLLIGAGLGRGHGADHQRRRLIALGQRGGQAIKQLADTEVVDRQDQPTGRCSDPNAGATHQAVEDTTALLQDRGDGRITALGGRKIGKHLGVRPVDTDHSVPGGTQHRTERSANTRGAAADSCNWHRDSP
ncbi:hypothetical protein D3C79_572890 [compost metagenome]